MVERRASVGAGSDRAGILQDDQLWTEVRSLELGAMRVATGLNPGGLATRALGSGLEFGEVREYVPGDEPRRLDAAASARFGRPFVRTHIEEREWALIFLLEEDAAWDAGLGPHSLRRLAARLAAIVGAAMVRTGDRLGWLIATPEGPHWLAPRPGRKALREGLHRFLGARNAAPAQGPAVSDLTAALIGRQRRRSAVWLLRPAGRSAGTVDAAALAARHETVVVHLHGPEALDPPRELLRVAAPDGVGESLVDFRSERVRRAARGQLEAAEAQAHAAYAQAGVPSFAVHGSYDVAEDAVALALESWLASRAGGGSTAIRGRAR